MAIKGSGAAQGLNFFPISWHAVASVK